MLALALVSVLDLESGTRERSATAWLVREPAAQHETAAGASRDQTPRAIAQTRPQRRATGRLPRCGRAASSLAVPLLAAAPAALRLVLAEPESRLLAVAAHACSKRPPPPHASNDR